MTLRHRPEGMRSAGDFRPVWEQIVSSHDGVFSLAQPPLASLYHTRAPHIDLVEEDDAYWLYADMPGIQPQDITIDVDDHGILILRGEYSGEVCGETQDDLLARPTRAFTRRFGLEESVEPASIATFCSDGKLAVRVPKVGAQQMAPPAVVEPSCSVNV